MGNNRRFTIDRKKGSCRVDYGLRRSAQPISEVNGGEFQSLNQLLLGADRRVVGLVSDGGAAMQMGDDRDVADGSEQ